MRNNTTVAALSETESGNSEQVSVARIQDIDELVVNTSPDIGNARVTSVAQKVLNYDPEALIWQDSPSLAIMLSNVFKWLVIFLIWLAVLSHFSNVMKQAIAAEQAQLVLEAEKIAKAQAAPVKKKKAKHTEDASQAKAASAPQKTSERTNAEAIYFLILAGGVLVFLIQTLRFIGRALRIKNIKYSMTSQRLKIESGILSKASNTYELHNLNGGHVYTPFFLRLFGRSNLYVSGLWLSGIKNAETVRDLIRNAGQIEASRLEKARFR